MKLFLSSYRLGDNPQSLVDLVGENKRAAVISNALDFSTEIERRIAGVRREIDDLSRLGFEPEEVDLRTYFGRSEELPELMSNFGLLWVMGGNTFVLRRAFKASGMDAWVRGQKANMELVYAGYSAGVCILSPTLRGLELVDDPLVIGEGYPEETIWDGLGLIDFAFAPHFDSPGHPESAAVGKEVDFYKRNGIKFEALRDGEVIIGET